MGGTDFQADLWDRYGQAYDGFFTEPNHAVAELALSEVGLEPGMSVLDVAAGAGALSIPAARMGAKVLATDLSPTMLQLLRQRASAEGLVDIDTEVMDGTALGVDDRRFDRVCSEYGVMFFLEPGLDEMRRVMAPAGQAAVVTWGHPDRVSLTVYRIALERALGHRRRASEIAIVLDPELLAPSMERAGFRQVRTVVHEGWYPATSGEDVWRWMRDVSPGYASLIADMSADDRSRVHDAVLEVTRERYGDRFDALPMESVIGIGS